MPLYEYKCLTCGSSFEILQKVNEPRLKKCPQCGGLLKKVLSPPALQFKGSGWYVTDYAQSKKPEEESKPQQKPESEKPAAPKKKKSSSHSSTD
jgi:putative FmdB family regulatory protein